MKLWKNALTLQRSLTPSIEYSIKMKISRIHFLFGCINVGWSFRFITNFICRVAEEVLESELKT